MLTQNALPTIVQQAINTDPARFARVHYTALPADAHRTEGAHRAYLQCLALAVGGRYPVGDSSPDDGAAWRALHDGAQRGHPASR